MSTLPSATTEAAPGKSCGTCTLCCKVMAVRPLAKPAGVWCRHCKPGVGCGIYETRPADCVGFTCMWLVDPDLGPEWKPERSKFLITPASNRNGLEIRCDRGFPEAWRKEPYHRQILAWAEGARPHDGMVTIRVGNRVTLVTPEGEFELGELGDGDQIVTELSGNRLVGVKVVRAPAG